MKSVLLLALLLALLLLSSVSNAAIISSKFLPVNVANGVAGLNSASKINVAQLPNATMLYLGAWNAATNTPALSDSGSSPTGTACTTATNGNIYRVSTAGSINLGSGSVSYFVGDLIICSSSIPAWQRSPAADGVISVNGYTGAVTLAASDVGLGSVLNLAQAPATSKYLVQGTSDAGLANAQFMGALGTGIVKNTTTTGVQSIAVAGTDFAPATSGSSILKGNGSGGFSSAVAGTDYQAAIGFTPENSANKSTDGTMAANSATLYPSQSAVVTYVASQIAGSSTPWLHVDYTLTATDITNQYMTLTQQCLASSVLASVSGVWGVLTADYTISVVSSKTVLSFVATTGWGTGSTQALVAGDVVSVSCQY